MRSYTFFSYLGVKSKLEELLGYKVLPEISHEFIANYYAAFVSKINLKLKIENPALSGKYIFSVKVNPLNL